MRKYKTPAIPLPIPDTEADRAWGMGYFDALNDKERSMKECPTNNLKLWYRLGWIAATAETLYETASPQHRSLKERQS